MLTRVTDTTMCKLQVCHQYIHSKGWLLWALEPCWLKPTAQDLELKCRFIIRLSEARRICLHHFPAKTFQTLWVLAPLACSDFGVLLSLDLLQVGYSYVWHHSACHQSQLCCCREVRKHPWNHGDASKSSNGCFWAKCSGKAWKTRRNSFPPPTSLLAAT